MVKYELHKAALDHSLISSKYKMTFWKDLFITGSILNNCQLEHGGDDQKTLRALKNQTYPIAEVIVIDNAGNLIEHVDEMPLNDGNVVGILMRLRSPIVPDS